MWTEFFYIYINYIHLKHNVYHLLILNHPHLQSFNPITLEGSLLLVSSGLNITGRFTFGFYVANFFFHTVHKTIKTDKCAERCTLS